jgi:hypothetical protein
MSIAIAKNPSQKTSSTMIFHANALNIALSIACISTAAYIAWFKRRRERAETLYYASHRREMDQDTFGGILKKCYYGPHAKRQTRNKDCHVQFQLGLNRTKLIHYCEEESGVSLVDDAMDTSCGATPRAMDQGTVASVGILKKSYYGPNHQRRYTNMARHVHFDRDLDLNSSQENEATCTQGLSKTLSAEDMFLCVPGTPVSAEVVGRDTSDPDDVHFDFIVAEDETEPSSAAVSKSFDVVPPAELGLLRWTDATGAARISSNRLRYPPCRYGS